MNHFEDFLERNGLDKKSYQYDGVAWCLRNELSLVSPFRVRGGFLADEMGLGKTITILGLMSANPLPLTLIVLPVIIMEQWVSTIGKYMQGQRCLVYYGNMKKKVTTEMIMEKYDIVVTTYQTVASEFNKKENKKEKEGKEGKEVLFTIAWNRVVFDEAHHIRNRSTKSWLACNSLLAEIRWLVSGTPVQNSKRDFYSLCGILKLPSSYYADKDNLPDFTNHFVLKRKKKDITGNEYNCGKIMEMVVVVPWKKEEERCLFETIHSVLSFNVNFTDDCEKKDSLATVKNDLEFSGQLIALLRAKQVCSLPYLLFPFLQRQGLFRDESGYFELFRDAVCCSSKMEMVVSTLVEKKNNGNGKLVFCQFLGEMEYLFSQLMNHGFHDIALLHGKTSVLERKNILSTPSSILILQIQTGSEGLNLQEYYSEIYFTSPHWNPCVEDQAIARCYRIGQTKPVSVFHFVMENTSFVSLDSYISQIQNVKREITSEFV